MEELISVVMGLYNENPQEATMAIDSILNQTHTNLEFIIALDDPKNIELKELLEATAKRDARVVPIVNEKNMGVAKSINNAIRKAKGEYIARMDGDDISVPSRLEIEMKALKQTGSDVITSNAVYIDENSQEIGQHSYIPEKKGSFNELLPIACNIVNPSILMKKSIFDGLDGYRPTYIEDYDLWLRMIANGAKIRGINQNLLKYRIRTNGLTKSKPLYGFLAAEYVKALYQTRQRTGNDDFSEANFQKFLQARGYSQDKEANFINITQTPNKIIRIFKLVLNSDGRKLLINDVRFKLKLRKLS